MGVETAFRSVNRRVLDALVEYEERSTATRQKALAFANQFGREGAMQQRYGMGHGWHMVGLPVADLPIPEGWRKSKDGYLVPDKRRKGGRALWERMQTLKDSGPDLPGMPAFHFGSQDGFSGSIHSPALWRHGVEVFAGWGCKMPTFSTDEDRHADKVDTIRFWEEIPLSRYYLALETYEAEKEPADV
jgi:hypothetical protein